MRQEAECALQKVTGINNKDELLKLLGEIKVINDTNSKQDEVRLENYYLKTI